MIQAAAAVLKKLNPDVIFFAEAFTRPKKMKHLAKLGFTMSYTYFTWKNTSWELREYLEELSQGDTGHRLRSLVVLYRDSAATPGSVLPSIHSRNAPPAVDT